MYQRCAKISAPTRHRVMMSACRQMDIRYRPSLCVSRCARARWVCAQMASRVQTVCPAPRTRTQRGVVWRATCGQRALGTGAVRGYQGLACATTAGSEPTAPRADVLMASRVQTACPAPWTRTRGCVVSLVNLTPHALGTAAVVEQQALACATMAGVVVIVVIK